MKILNDIQIGDQIRYIGNDSVERTVEYTGVVGFVKYLKGEPECMQMSFVYNGQTLHIPFTAWKLLKQQGEIQWLKNQK